MTSGKKVSHGWYVLFRGSEFGPLSTPELVRLLESPKLADASVHIWRRGLEGWKEFDRARVRGRIDDAVLADFSRWPEPAERVGGAGVSAETRPASLAAPEGASPAGDRVLHRDGRANQRAKVAARVTVFGINDADPTIGVCIDLSQGGLRVASARPYWPSVGETLSLEIVPVSGAPMRVRGEVLWTAGTEFGIRFRGLDNATRLEIQECVDRAAREAVWGVPVNLQNEPRTGTR